MVDPQAQPPLQPQASAPQPMASPQQAMLWQRLANLRPSLPRHVRIQRREYQGELWYLLEDTSNGRYHRLSPSAWGLLAAMDGQRTLEQVLIAGSQMDTAVADEDRPQPEDLIHLLQYLHVADLLVCDMSPSAAELFNRQQQKRRQPWLRLLMNPLTWNIPLGNPDAWLGRWVPYCRWLTSPVLGLVWLLLVGYALTQAVLHWDQLSQGHIDRVMTPFNLALLWLTYPLLKLVHELGHAFFTKIWGGQVTRIGLVVILGMPLPYVDASAATGFASKRRRLMVTAAGMAVEVFVAAVSLLLWLQVQPGLVRDCLYNLMLIGGLSTLVFNGNPLARFDGYHLLTDVLDFPNLATRANQQLNYWLRHLGFGIKGLQQPAANGRQAFWLGAYGIGAFIYRLSVMLTLLLLTLHYFPQVGLLLVFWVLFFQLLMPLAKAIYALSHNPELLAHRKRTLAFCSGATALVVLVLLLPLPQSTRIQGVLWMGPEASIKAEVDGLVEKVLVSDGAKVEQGQLLIQLANPQLQADLQQKRAELREVRTRFERAWGQDQAQAQLFQQELKRIADELTDIQNRAAKLRVLSPAAGVFRQLQMAELKGSFFHQGDQIGVLVQPRPVTIKTALTEDQLGLLRSSLRAVEVRLADQPGSSHRAVLDSNEPVSSFTLPSELLGAKGGGNIAVDPAQVKAVKTFEPVFLLDLSLPDVKIQGHFGERAFIRFEHAPESLFERIYRRLQQIFIRNLG